MRDTNKGKLTDKQIESLNFKLPEEDLVGCAVIRVCGEPTPALEEEKVENEKPKE